VDKLLATQFNNAQELTKSEVPLLTATDAQHAQLDKLSMILELTAIPQDQFADATRLSTQTTNAKIAQSINLVTVVKLLATLLTNALEQTRLEELLLTATDVMHAQQVKLLMIPELIAILQDQHAHATKLLMLIINAKIAQ
jgi:hypothetical protein